MRRIFISHSSLDEAAAFEMRDWLTAQGWADVFLAHDPEKGIAPGEIFREELRKAGENAAAVVLIISPNWMNSNECWLEYMLARYLGKLILPVIVAPTQHKNLPSVLTDVFQIADISDPTEKTTQLNRLSLGLKRAGLHPNAFSWPPKDEPNRCVFRGFKRLDVQDAAIFFGRDTRITKARDELMQMRDDAPERILVILGASGAGKSSFLRAGILARLQRDPERFCVFPVMRPGRAAMSGPTGLARTLGCASGTSIDAIGKRLQALRAAHVSRLPTRESGAPPNPRAPTIILSVDQGEELFAAGDAEAPRAVAAITEAVAADPNLIVVMTIRSDSFSLLQADTRLAPLPRNTFDLSPLPPEAWRDVIEGPSRLANPPIEIEPELTERLVADLGGTDTLPLLAFTLERLAAEHSGDNKLELHEYVEQMRGLAGAIEAAVSEAFAEAQRRLGNRLTRRELEVVAKEAFVPALVRVDDPRSAPKRRVALLDRFTGDRRALVDCLIDQRLLVAGNGDGDETGYALVESTVEVAHEALFEHWTDLKRWVDARRSELLLADSVLRAAKEWDAERAKSTASSASNATARGHLVHRGERLPPATSLLRSREFRRLLGIASVRYLRACRDADRADAAERERREKRVRLFRRASLAAACLVLVVSAIGALLVVAGQRNLVRATSLTLARTAERLAEDGQYVHANRLAVLAARGNLLAPTTGEALATRSFIAQGLKLRREYRHDVRGAAFSKDESRILTWSDDDDTARLWEAATGAQVGPPLQHDDSLFGVRGATFSKDESLILTWSDDDTARLWDAATGAQVGPPLQHDRSRGGVGGATFSKDESRILTWSADNTARLWDVATGAQVGPPLQHDDSLFGVRGAAFLKDESLILTWSDDDTARLWDAATGAQVGPPLRHDGSVNGAAFSKDESLIVTWSDDDTARLWDAATGAQVGPPLQHDRSRGGVGGATFSKDESRILTWSADNTARLWDVATGAQVGPPLRHDDSLFGIRGAAFSKDESRILTWSIDTIRLWDAATGAQVGPPLRHDDSLFGVNGAAFSEDESRILTWSGDNTARLWDAATGTQVGPPLRHGDSLLGVSGAAFSKDQSRVLTWGDDTIRLWDAATGAQVGPPLQHDDSLFGVRGAAFLKDESRILTWSDDDTARLWDAVTGAQVGPPLRHDGSVNGAAFSKDESRILTWSADNTARLWDVATGAQVGPPLQHDGSPLGVRGAAFSKDESLILTWSGDTTARLWDAATGAQVGPPLRHDGSVNGAVFSKDESLILTRSDDDTARLWDAATGAQVGPPLQHFDVQGAAISKDESRILTWGSIYTARLWDAATGAQVGPPLWHDGRHDGSLLGVNGAAFSKEGSRILTWSGDNTARLWDAATGAQVGPPLRHDGTVRGAAFSKDESRILTWSGDDTARLWDVRWAMADPDDPDFVTKLCAEKLVGNAVEADATTQSGTVLKSVRHIDGEDIRAAPILRGREGEDICAPPPSSWKAIRTAVYASVFQLWADLTGSLAD